jgi:hypothetical protein
MAVGVVLPDGVVLPPENVGVLRPDRVVFSIVVVFISVYAISAHHVLK